MAFHRSACISPGARRGIALKRVFGTILSAILALSVFAGAALADTHEREEVPAPTPPEVLEPEALEVLEVEAPSDDPAGFLEEVLLEASHEPYEPSHYAASGLSLPDQVTLGSIVADAGMFRSLVLRPPPPRPAGADRYVLPADKGLVSPGQLGAPHHDYPAWDLGLPTGTAVYSVTAGYVTKATTGGRCGNGVEIAGYDGFTYLYCHASALTAYTGQSVDAGDRIMLSGNTGNSTAPHLHLQVQSPGGALLCPQALLLSWYGGGEMSPAQASSAGCWYETPDDEKDKKKKKKARRSTKSGSTSSSGSGSGGSESPEPSPSPKQSPKPASSPKPAGSPKPSSSPTPTPLDVDAPEADPTLDPDAP